MTQQDFEDWVINVHCQLYHVMPTDLDDKYGVRLDELIILEEIAKNPEVLKFENLISLVKNFINDEPL
jgi:hypothetical protein